MGYIDKDPDICKKRMIKEINIIHNTSQIKPTRRGWNTHCTTAYYIPFYVIGDAVQKNLPFNPELWGYIMEWTGNGAIITFVPKDMDKETAERWASGKLFKEEWDKMRSKEIAESRRKTELWKKRVENGS